MKIKGFGIFFLASSVCVLMCFNSLTSQAANNLKNKDLLEFPKSERDAYLTGAILSTAHTLSIFHSKDMGQCFSDWFLENPDVRISEMEGIYAEKSKSCAIKHFTGTASAQMRQVKTEVSS